MESRPKEEKWLFEAIKEKDTDSARGIITIIQDKMSQINSSGFSPRLNSLDSGGNSFLGLSIINQAYGIANILLDLQKDDPVILFGKNKRNRTLIWLAACHGNKAILEKILSIVVSHYHDESLKEKIWLAPDILGETPLHVASSLTNTIVTISYLLEFIQRIEGSERLSLILNNQTNVRGDTTLHYAFRVENIPAIALLTKYGADWKIPNNQKETPFDYFCEYELGQQRQLISALEITTEQLGTGNENRIKTFLQVDRQYQNYVLNLYQQALLENKKNVSKKTYLNLATQVSLKNTLIANALINPSIKNAFGLKNQSKTLIHDDEVSFEIENSNDIIIDIENDNEAAFENNFILEQEQRIQDKNLLNDLIEKIDIYLTDLQNNPRLSQKKQALRILVPILSWLVFWGVEGWFIYDKILSTDLTNCKELAWDGTSCGDENHPANISHQTLAFEQLFGFGLFGGIGAFLCCFSSLLKCWKSEVPISQNEWKELISLLEKSILEKLSTLSNNQVSQDHQATIIKLQTILNNLKDNQSRQEIIDTFKNLSSILKKIRINLNLEHYPKGIRLFDLKEQNSDENPVLNTEDETQSLLHNRVLI